jgi:hypothetical protein
MNPQPPLPHSHLFTCRRCGLGVDALIPLATMPHRTFTPLLIGHLDRCPRGTDVRLEGIGTTEALWWALMALYEKPAGFDAEEGYRSQRITGAWQWL